MHRQISAPAHGVTVKSSRARSPYGPFVNLQQTIGNRAVNGMIQAKLAISSPDDEYEQEAERVARLVVASPSAPALHRQCACGDSLEPDVECAECQEKRLLLQRRAADQAKSSLVPPIVHEVLRSPGQPLDPDTRTFMESRFRRDFGQVRLHTGAGAEQSARDVNADAYTVGREIVFGAGQFAPRTEEGQRLMAHELTHVAQQGSTPYLPVSMGQSMLQRSPRPMRKGRGRESRRAKGIDLRSAERVMEWILMIINRMNPSEPSQWPDDALLTAHRDLLSLWHEITYGRKRDGSRARLEGESFLSAHERAKAETEPILNTVIRQGGGSWRRLLAERYFAIHWELEKRADSERRILELVKTTTLFWPYSNPEPVPVDEFLRVATAQSSRRVILQRGAGIQVPAKAGITYYPSKDEPRLLLWAGPEGVFFLLDDQLYKQSLAGFSDDIILGTIIKAAQVIAPFVNFMTFVVDLAISLSPVGVLYDLTMATRAAAEGRWGDAALELLPGPAIGKVTKLAKATRVGRAVFRAGAKGAQVVGRALAGAATYVGKGIAKLRGKLSRGLWLVTEGVGEAAGKKAYYFLDEAEDVWRAVPEEEAVAFIRCTKCDLTDVGKGESKLTREATSGLGAIGKAKPGALKELAGKIHGMRKLGGQAIAVVEVRVGNAIRYVAASNASAPLTRSQRLALKEVGIDVAARAKGIREVIHAEHNIEYWVTSLRRRGQRVEVLRWGISAGEKGAYVCAGCRAIVEHLGGTIEEFGPTLSRR